MLAFDENVRWTDAGQWPILKETKQPFSERDKLGDFQNGTIDDFEVEIFIFLSNRPFCLKSNFHY